MIAQPELDISCLFLDVDGTLVDFASRPEQVTIPPSLIETLARVNVAFGGAVAFVSGRQIDSLDELFQPLKFTAAGVHGAELRASPGAAIVHAAAPRPCSRIVSEAMRISAAFTGTYVEDKGHALAIHFSATPWVSEDLSAAISELVASVADRRLEVLRGNAVIEIKGRAYDKGRAIEQLMRCEPFTFRSPIFIGDDTTDIPGFAATMRLGGRAYSVGRRIPGLNGSFESPDEVVAWLERASHQSRPVR